MNIDYYLGHYTFAFLLSVSLLYTLININEI